MSFEKGDEQVSEGGGTEVDDGCLVEKLRCGEGWALGVLWKRYAALLYTQAARILHNPAETEDVVAEVFEEAWKRVESYRPERARPVAWLLTLARRRAIDRLRQRRSSQRMEERLQREEGVAQEAVCCSVEEQVRLQDLRGMLQEALLDLPAEQRLTVCLAYYEGCTQREIARRTCTPMGTVKSRLEMALRKLRDALRRREGGYPFEQPWVDQSSGQSFWRKTWDAMGGRLPGVIGRPGGRVGGGSRQRDRSEAGRLQRDGPSLIPSEPEGSGNGRGDVGSSPAGAELGEAVDPGGG
jgi:RNA polymerase sigma-70 factor (ECF subfamily)